MHPVALASCCAAMLAWLVFKPPPANLRLNRLLVPEAIHGQRARERLLEPPLLALEGFRERRRIRQRWRGAVIELCDGMASELAAGRTPDEAFTITAALLDPLIAAQLLDTPPHASIRSTQSNSADHRTISEPLTSTRETIPSDLPEHTTPRPFRPAVSAGAPSDDLPSPRERLEDLARQPGAEGLRLLAACWGIAAEQGGTLATVLDDLATALRDEEANRQEIATQLAGPRATARLLSALPLLGLGMAAALGAEPLSFLLGSPPGLGCLSLGVTLNLAGLWWTSSLAKAAEEVP